MSRLGIRTAVPALPWQRQQLSTVPRVCDGCGDRDTRLAYVNARWLCKPCKKESRK